MIQRYRLSRANGPKSGLNKRYDMLKPQSLPDPRPPPATASHTASLERLWPDDLRFDKMYRVGRIFLSPRSRPWLFSMTTTSRPGYELVDFTALPQVPCPCGLAKRAFTEVADFPGTIHVTEISADARLHYHQRLTETYYFLECGPDAKMQLDDQLIDVRPGVCLMIRPGTRHRAVGKMKVLIVVYPKFDPEDEWFDE